MQNKTNPIFNPAWIQKKTRGKKKLNNPGNWDTQEALFYSKHCLVQRFQQWHQAVSSLPLASSPQPWLQSQIGSTCHRQTSTFKTLEAASVFHLSGPSPLEIKNTSSWHQKKTGNSKVSLESHSMHQKTSLCSGKWFILIALG